MAPKIEGATGAWNQSEKKGVTRAMKHGLTEQQEAFLEWLVEPDVEEVAETETAFAARLGVNRTTLGRWKKDATFRAEWDKRLREKNVGPEKLQTLMDRTYELASSQVLIGSRGTSDQLKAIELYMKLVDRISPQKIILEDRSAAELDDDELAKKLREHLAVLEGSGDAAP